MPIGFSNEQLCQSAAGPIPAEVREQFLAAAAAAFVLAGPGTDAEARIARLAEAAMTIGWNVVAAEDSNPTKMDNVIHYHMLLAFTSPLNA
jgi:hypothetical protein